VIVVSLKSSDVIELFRSKGIVLAAVSVLSTIVLGVVDQFTSRIIPSVATVIDNYFDPPFFLIIFSPPVASAELPSVSEITSQGSQQVQVESVPPSVRVRAGAGSYMVRVSRSADGVAQELVQVKRITANGEVWQVDTGDRSWANAAALTGPDVTPQALGPQEPAQAAPPTLLNGTRWTLAETDFAVLGSQPDPLLRSALSAALSEVGTYESGSERERYRIAAYWQAAGWEPWENGVVGNLIGQPWGGALLAWIYTQAGAQPPSGAAGFRSWLAWGDGIEPSAAMPGMLAIFDINRTKEAPEAVSRLLVGIVLRRQADCIEVVMGNIADRVVVSCVATAALAEVRKPNQLLVPARGKVGLGE
jgi:hypothetical protein